MITSTSLTWQFDGSDSSGAVSLLMRFATPKKPSHRPIVLRCGLETGGLQSVTQSFHDFEQQFVEPRMVAMP